MISEKIESRPSATEIKLPEPSITFMVVNGVGKEIETTVTLSEWKNSVRLVAEEWRSLKTPLAQIRERAKKLERKTHGSGRPRSSTEKRQLSQREEDNGVISLGKRNKLRRSLLLREGKWLLLSSPESPLKVRLNAEGNDEIISGKPLDEGEAAWKTFIFQSGATILLVHPNANVVREYFILRRNEQLGIEERFGEAGRKLEDFQNRAVDQIPDELASFCSRISALDFKRPPLSEFEILRRDD